MKSNLKLEKTKMYRHLVEFHTSSQCQLYPKVFRGSTAPVAPTTPSISVLFYSNLTIYKQRLKVTISQRRQQGENYLVRKRTSRTELFFLIRSVPQKINILPHHIIFILFCFLKLAILIFYK